MLPVEPGSNGTTNLGKRSTSKRSTSTAGGAAHWSYRWGGSNSLPSRRCRHRR